MIEFSHTVTNPDGIHARPARELVRKAKEFADTITLVKGEEQCDMKRLLAVMTLSVKQGDTIRILTEGAKEQETAAVLEAYIKEHI